MSLLDLFKRKKKREDGYEWRIFHEVNDLNDRRRWVVFKPGFFSPYYARRPEYHYFDSYEEAFALYAEKAGWHTTKTEFPQKPESL